MVNMKELFAYDHIGDQPMERVPLDRREREEYALAEDDLLFARQSLVASGAGKVSIVADASSVMTFESHIIRVRLDQRKALPMYYYFYFQSPEGRARMQSIVMQVAAAGIRGSDLKLLRVPNPPLETQQAISAILTAYDDLIENNLRRMAILEEMAQAIYREWFVEFRYPGHEGARMVDSELGPVPDGWDVTSFSDIADVLSGGTPRTSVPEYWGGDIPFFTPKDSGGSFWATTTERTITRLGLDNCNSQLYPKGTIFITARGTVGKVMLSSADMAVNQSCYALRNKDGVSQYFVFLALLAEAATLRKQAHGAVFDTITMDTFDRLRLAVPPEHLLDSWDRTVADMMQLLLNLSLTNLRLGEIRDLLLPRLISGELDASNINIDTEEDEL